MNRNIALAAGLPLFACSQADAAPADDTPAAAVESPAAAVVETPAPTSAAKVGCGDGEDVLFSCVMPGGKRLAVCGIDDADGKRMAQYRFGGDSAELVLPVAGGSPGRFASVSYSGGERVGQ